ncbi:MAG: helix-turn-helix transcriptional regulator [Polaromonas sp.]
MEVINSNKLSYKSDKDTPLPVNRALNKLGQDIALARRRRRMTQASLAERAGISLATVGRMEAGDPRIPIHFIARVLHVFGEVQALSQLLDTAADDMGLALMDAALPKRVRSKKSASAVNGAL